MNAKELRSRKPAELQDELLKLRREQFSLRMQRATGQTAKPTEFQRVRKDIARLKTVMREQRPAAAAGATGAKRA
jgi:large subunit ribosomal protein L29